MEPGDLSDQGWETVTGEVLAQPVVEGRPLGSSPNSIERGEGISATDADAHYNFGLMLMQVHGDVKGAEMMYRRCITLDPEHTSAHYNLANLLYTVLGDILAAEIMYRRCIDLNPTHLSAICNYGTLLKDQLDDLEGAILLYGLANKLDPHDSTVLGNCSSARAKEAERRGEHAEAAHLYREAVLAWQGTSDSQGACLLPDDDPDVLECTARAVELEAWAVEAEAVRILDEEEQAAAAAASGGREAGNSPKSPMLNGAEGTRVDDVLAERSKRGGASSSTAKAILKSLNSSSLGRFLRSSTKKSPSGCGVGGSRTPLPAAADTSNGIGEIRTPLPAAADSSGGESNADAADFEFSEDGAFTLARASPVSPLTPLFGCGVTAEPSRTAAGADTDSASLAEVSAESALGALAANEVGGNDGGGEEDGEEDDEIEFAGASLLEQHALASEALEAPRRLVTAANALVSKRKFSEALTHYYDALEVFEQLKVESAGREGLQRDLMRDTAKTLNNLAAVLHQLRKFDEAIGVYERALAIKRASDGAHHFSVGHTLYNMACLHMDHGKLPDAAQLMQQSLEIYELAFGADHQLSVDVEQQLLGLLHEIKMAAEEDDDDDDDEGGVQLACDGDAEQATRSPAQSDSGGGGGGTSEASTSCGVSCKQGNRPNHTSRPSVPKRKVSLNLSHVRISRSDVPGLGSSI